MLELKVKGGSTVKFDGFLKGDFETLKKLMTEAFKIEVQTEQLATRGWNWGNVEFLGLKKKKNKGEKWVDFVLNF